jgi:fatty acid desaturase
LNAELIIAAALIWNLINTCVNILVLYYFPIFLVTVCQHLFYVQSVGANLNTINLLQ